MRRARARADADLQRALDATRVWVNASAEYDFMRGTGTYFASAISHFLATIFVPQLGGTVADAFVVFPDHGAHVRFYSMVHSRVSGLPLERICYISKSRVGEDITQSETLQYIDSDGLTRTVDEPIFDGAKVVIIDDFTNTGSTLFGGAQIIRKLAAGRNVTVGAMVAHFVAKYDRDTVSAFVTKLYGEPGKGAALDSFHCTDSIPRVTGWLEEELRPRLAEGLPRKAHLVSLAPVVADWVATHPPRAVSQSWASFLLSLVNPLTYVELVRPHTPFRRRAVA